MVQGVPKSRPIVWFCRLSPFSKNDNDESRVPD